MSKRTTKHHSAHFSLSEWEKRGKAPKRAYRHIQRIMDTLEVGHAELSRLYNTKVRCTITPAGGFRSRKVNLQNPGRAKASRHLTGDAADTIWHWWTGKEWVKVPTAVVFHLFRVLQKANRCSKGGLAAYGNSYTHIDARGHRSRWRKAPKMPKWLARWRAAP